MRGWMKIPDMSGSPAGMTWHHDTDVGSLKLVDRADHVNQIGIYHPDGEGGREKWSGGKDRRKGKLDGETGCPL